MLFRSATVSLRRRELATRVNAEGTREEEQAWEGASQSDKVKSHTDRDEREADEELGGGRQRIAGRPSTSTGCVQSRGLPRVGGHHSRLADRAINHRWGYACPPNSCVEV